MPVVSCQLPVASCQLPVASCQPSTDVGGVMKPVNERRNRTIYNRLSRHFFSLMDWIVKGQKKKPLCKS
ncbi:hypothetical protein QUF72_18265 [Desulfobacterales bacterium HSG2]|nr:hypothetical protein [Desulfobacterales bacterium HSG2]